MEALVKAGLGHLYHGHPISQKMKQQPARNLSNDDLIAELKRVYALVGKPYLARDDFNHHSTTSVESIRIRFGSFARGLEVAGIPRSPQTHRRLADAQCFENLATVWTRLGRAPEYREMSEPPSTIQYRHYEVRWGTWRRTLMAFVEWANSEGGRGEIGPEGDRPTPEPKAEATFGSRSRRDRRSLAVGETYGKATPP